ncbi:uncharacterized protein [Equus asinus]|uniref:uncharacterized protein isoform X2 n=1 Tax=Equus asinus TaxID=9793 RepID=UPI0038F70499
MLDEQRRVRTLTSLQLAAMDSVWLGVTRQPVLELSGLLSLTSGHWHWLQLVPLLGLWNRADLHLAPPCGPGFLVARRPLDSQTSDREAQGPVCERLSKQALPLALEVLWHHFFCHESKGRGGGVHLSVGKRKLKKSVWKRKDCCDYLGKRSATSSVKYRRLESKEHALCFGVHWQNMWFHPGEPHLCAQHHVPWVASSQFRIPRREMHLAELGPGRHRSAMSRGLDTSGVTSH